MTSMLLYQLKNIIHIYYSQLYTYLFIIIYIFIIIILHLQSYTCTFVVIKDSKKYDLINYTSFIDHKAQLDSYRVIFQYGIVAFYFYATVNSGTPCMTLTSKEIC